MKKVMLTLAALTLLAGSASADVLWDQYAPSFADGGYNDYNAGCFGFNASDAFQANDVTFPESVNITSITTVYDYYGDPGQDLSGLTTEAYLMIIPNAGVPDFSSANPQDFGTVPVTVTIVNIDGTDVQELTASGLDINLPAGDYWVSFNPIAMAPSGLSNRHYVATTQVGDPMLYGTFCSGGPWYTSADLGIGTVDSTLLIEGTLDTVPTEESSFGTLKALYR